MMASRSVMARRKARSVTLRIDAMAVHRALGEAGGARGVHEKGEVLGIDGVGPRGEGRVIDGGAAGEQRLHVTVSGRGSSPKSTMCRSLGSRVAAAATPGGTSARTMAR